MLSHHCLRMHNVHTAIACLSGIALLFLWPSLSNSAAQLPALPQTTIDTTYSPPVGSTVTVNAGGDFQAALNNANLGDTIVLQAGATFTGPFTLPNKTSGSGWIYVTSSNYSSLPAPGNRADPTDAVNMPKIAAKAGNGRAIVTEKNAHHYRFVGIEIAPPTNEGVTQLVQIGNYDTSVATLPHDITFDRCYIHGNPTLGGRRGMAMDGISVAVIDSYVSDFKQVGADTQALWSFNSPGPLKIANNYLEAAGENVMFGGADPAISNLVPSDIEITHNYFFKPLSWKGSTWTVKNFLELKNARRVLVEKNLFENVWGAAQAGFAILITPKNQGGTAPWTTTEDITFRSNNLNNIGGGVNICGSGCGNPPTQLAARILIENNIFVVTAINADGRILQMLAGPIDVKFNHNTGFSPGNLGSIDNPPKGDRFEFTNNIVTRGYYGFKGSGTTEGNATLNAYLINWTFSNNAIIGPSSGTYPSGNYFPADTTAVGFFDYAVSNYRISDSSPYKNAGTDGKDLGADIDAVAKASTGVAGTGAIVKLSNLRVVP